MYEIKRKIGILLGDNKEKLKKFKVVQKMLSSINLKHSMQQNIAVQNYGVQALKILYAECKKHDVHLWLDFGTLLGWYREKDFISYDMDIDLGAYYEDVDKFEEIKKSLLNQGFVYSRKFEYDGELVEESFSYGTLNVDIVFYRKNEAVKNIMTYLIVYAMNLDKKPVDIKGYIEQNNLTGLKKTEFKGIEVEVPENTAEYLANYYGENFMTPIPNFDWKASGLYPELEDSSKCGAIVYDGASSEK